MCFSVTFRSDGAYFPPGSAPPAAAKLRQAVQLGRQNSPPRATASLSMPLVSYCDLLRMAGPGGRGGAFGGRWGDFFFVVAALFWLALGAGGAIGIRPGAAWEVAGGAPAPGGGGAVWVPRLVTTPSPFSPW